MNERIRVREVRVVDEEGGQIGIMRTLDALDLARSKKLDLVEVAPKARPPVCRIMDYGKYLYQQSKREHSARKKQRNFSIKEIKLRPKTGEHDYLFKLRHIEEFLAKLNKVKVTILFRGRERTHPEIGDKILRRIASHFGEKVIVEQPPRFEGHNMTMVLAPGAFYKETPKSQHTSDEVPHAEDEND